MHLCNLYAFFSLAKIYILLKFIALSQEKKPATKIFAKNSKSLKLSKTNHFFNSKIEIQRFFFLQC